MPLLARKTLAGDCFLLDLDVLDASAGGTAKPPCARLESDEQVNPAQWFLDHPVAGGHCQEEEAGDGGNLLQTPVAHVPLKATRMAGAVSPHDHSGGQHDSNCAQQAERAEIGR